MTRCEIIHIFETTSTIIKCKKKRSLKDISTEKSNYDQLYIYRISSSYKRTYKPRIFHIDTDSFTIGVDDHCSYCICKNSDLFITDIISMEDIVVKGINGNLPTRGGVLLDGEQ